MSPNTFSLTPLNEYLTPNLQGYRLNSGAYQAIAPETGGGVKSRELNLKFQVSDTGRLRSFDLSTGTLLRQMDELVDDVAVLTNQRDAAQAELAKLREELARLKK
jgi:hypothetical protein